MLTATPWGRAICGFRSLGGAARAAAADAVELGQQQLDRAFELLDGGGVDAVDLRLAVQPRIDLAVGTALHAGEGAHEAGALVAQAPPAAEDGLGRLLRDGGREGGDPAWPTAVAGRR